jgi:hypothetical protein
MYVSPATILRIEVWSKNGEKTTLTVNAKNMRDILHMWKALIFNTLNAGVVQYAIKKNQATTFTVTSPEKRDLIVIVFHVNEIF